MNSPPRNARQQGDRTGSHPIPPYPCPNGRGTPQCSPSSRAGGCSTNNQQTRTPHPRNQAQRTRRPPPLTALGVKAGRATIQQTSLHGELLHTKLNTCPFSQGKHPRNFDPQHLQQRYADRLSDYLATLREAACCSRCLFSRRSTSIMSSLTAKRAIHGYSARLRCGTLHGSTCRGSRVSASPSTLTSSVMAPCMRQHKIHSMVAPTSLSPQRRCVCQESSPSRTPTGPWKRRSQWRKRLRLFRKTPFAGATLLVYPGSDTSSRLNSMIHRLAEARHQARFSRTLAE